MIDKLLLLFVLLPLIELALLTVLSHYTSLTTTILFIIVTGLLGTWLARSQGLITYRRIQAELAAGRMPAEALLDGVLILVAGVLLIAPGVLTDMVGILLMFPPTRAVSRYWLIRWFGKNFQIKTFGPTSTPQQQDDVVDSYATDSASPISKLGEGEESPGV